MIEKFVVFLIVSRFHLSIFDILIVAVSARYPLEVSLIIVFLGVLAKTLIGYLATDLLFERQLKKNMNPAGKVVGDIKEALSAAYEAGKKDAMEGESGSKKEA